MIKKSVRCVTNAINPQTVTLPCIFGFAQLLGVSTFHTRWRHLLYSLSLQVINVVSVLSWVYLTNVFAEKSIYGFAWGVLHVVTTLTSSVAAFETWKNGDKVQSALDLLDSLKFCQTRWDIWLPVFNVTSLLVVSVLDLFLDKNVSFVTCLQVFVYCFPLLQILTATSQFVGSVMICERCLDNLSEKAGRISGIALMKDYNTLHAACHLINDAFSVQNLFAVVSHGSAFALSSYILTIAALNYFPPKVTPKKIWVSLFICVSHICYGLFIFKPCQSVENKCRRFLEAVNDKTPSSSAEDRILRRMALKIITFTACDFFKINFSALGSIVTTLFTYQVILLQFAQAEDEI